MFAKAALGREAAWVLALITRSRLCQGGLGGALLPMVELQQKEPVPPAQRQYLGWEEGGLAPCHAPLGCGFCLRQEEGAESRWASAW